MKTQVLAICIFAAPTAVAGAAVGCLVGRHHARKKAAEQQAAQQRQDKPISTARP